jgi:hypothetical protein
MGRSGSTASGSKKPGRGKKKEIQLPLPAKLGAVQPVVPPNQACAWKRSTMKEKEIKHLMDAGLLQEKAIMEWNSAYDNAWPTEKHPNEIPMFARFVEFGLGLPTSDFFWGLLDFYKIEHMHLNPNSILVVAIFVHFCEAFLGIQPHFALFRKLYRLKPHPNHDNPQVVGGAGFQLREN